MIYKQRMSIESKAIYYTTKHSWRGKYRKSFFISKNMLSYNYKLLVVVFLAGKVAKILCVNFSKFHQERVKNSKPFFKLPVIWLEIILKFISRISRQIIGNLKKGFGFLNTFLVKFADNIFISKNSFSYDSQKKILHLFFHRMSDNFFKKYMFLSSPQVL